MTTPRTTLMHSSDYNLHAYLAPVRSPRDGFALTITSQRQAVRHPDEEHVCFFTCLDRPGLQALADLIQHELQARGATA